MSHRTQRLFSFSLVPLIACLGSCSSTSQVYRDSWQPVAIETTERPRLVTSALLVKSAADLEALRAAGAVLVGWHEAHKAWALRSGSTGGTHFVPVAAKTSTLGTSCVSWGSSTVCSSVENPGRWSRVAVFRLAPDRWHLLPPHLIPPQSDVVTNGASAVRLGCRDVRATDGTVMCGANWQVTTIGGTVQPGAAADEAPPRH
jgi:hypothetical protein